MFEKKISPFTAMIVVCDKKGDDHIGSGVLISANHILTCSHVCLLYTSPSPRDTR